MLVIGDEDTSILMNSQPVRPPIVFANKIEVAGWVDAKDTPPWNVDAIKVARPVERWAFQNESIFVPGI